MGSLGDMISNSNKTNHEPEIVEKKKFSFGKAYRNPKTNTSKAVDIKLEENLKTLKVEPIQQMAPSKELISPPEIKMAEGFSEKAITELNEQFQMLFSCLGDREVIGEALKNVLTHIKEHIEYRNILAPEHFGTMVQAMRETYGVAVEIKEKKVAKKGKNAEIEEAFSAGLGDLAKFTVKVGDG